MFRYAFSLVLVAWCVSTVQCLDRGTQHPRNFSFEHQNPSQALPTRSHIDSSRNSNTLQSRDSGYNRDTFFEFRGFEEKVGPFAALFKDYATLAVLESMQVLGVALAELVPELTKTTPEHRSFVRYFNPDKRELIAVVGVFERLMAVMGYPVLDTMRTCIDNPKMIFYVLDHVPMEVDSSKTCETHSDTTAYQNTAFIDGKETSYIMLCTPFFAHYRKLEHAGTVKLLDWGNVIDPGCANEADTPSFSTSRVMLHEMLHNHLAYEGINDNIDDLEVVRPDDHETYSAYRAFYSMHVKDWSPGGESPLLNVDNYVYMALEIYYKKKYDLSDWTDPPDPKYVQACPALNIDPPYPWPPTDGSWPAPG